MNKRITASTTRRNSEEIGRSARAIARGVYDWAGSRVKRGRFAGAAWFRSWTRGSGGALRRGRAENLAALQQVLQGIQNVAVAFEVQNKLLGRRARVAAADEPHELLSNAQDLALESGRLAQAAPHAGAKRFLRRSTVRGFERSSKRHEP